MHTNMQTDLKNFLKINYGKIKDMIYSSINMEILLLLFYSHLDVCTSAKPLNPHPCELIPLAKPPRLVGPSSSATSSAPASEFA